MRDLSVFRLYHLVRNRLVADLTPIAIGVAIAVGIQLLALLLSLLTGGPVNGLLGGRDGQYLFVLAMAGCFLVSSRAFFEMQSSRSGTDWLLLPATTLEKYLGALVSTQIVVPLLAELAALLFWVSAHGFSGLVLPGAQAVGVFLVLNLVLMTGSTVFRKWAGLKTVASSVTFLIAVGLVFALVARVVWAAPGYNVEQHLTLFDAPVNINAKGLAAGRGPVLETLWLSLLYAVTPVAAIVFGFFRVSEKEARDAVQ